MAVETKILVIDDEVHILRALRALLSMKRYTVLQASSGAEGLAQAIEHAPDMVILDLEMPEMHGFDVCRELRQWYTGPILVLSVISNETDKITALDLGADDYIIKPYRGGELLARIRALLRRTAPVTRQPVITVGTLAVDIAHRRVTVGDQSLHLTPIEYQILSLLISNLDCVVTTRMLVSHVWGDGWDGDAQTLRVHMKNLRHKLTEHGSDASCIQTEQGIGFRFISGQNES